MPEILRSGIGYIEGGIRYGYTDNSLWYLGEARMYWKGQPQNAVVMSYDQLKMEVDTWIAGNPGARATRPTSDETKCSIGFQGIGIARHEYWYQNYIFVGKPDPSPYPTPTNLQKVFQYLPLGVAGVGLGYMDNRANLRAGYTDRIFWYKGECRLMRISQLPVSAVDIPIPVTGPISALGIKYYRSTLDNRVYVSNPSNEYFVLFDYTELVTIVDDWERANTKTTVSNDWFAAGFLWLGQQYWQAQGAQLLPDELALSLSDCEKNLATIMKWLPGTKLATNAGRTGIPVSLPQFQNQNAGGLSLSDLLILQYLNAQKGTKKPKKTKKRRR